MSEAPMREDDPMRLSGATWCPEHHRWECSVNAKRTVERCHGSAILGTRTCRMHAGRSASLARAQGEANLLAWSAAAHADAKALDPGQVVMDQLRVAVLRADLYGEMLRLQLGDEGVDGLVGLTYAAGRDGARVETGERVRGLAAEEGVWRDRVVRFAKAAHDMGIAERHVELEQERASLVVSAFKAALGVLGLPPGEASRAIEVFLRALELGGPGVVAGEVEV